MIDYGQPFHILCCRNIPSMLDLAEHIYHGMDVATLTFMVVAIANRRGCVSPLFDVSDRLCLIEITTGTEVRREAILLKNRDPFRRAGEIANMRIDVIICGAISRPFETALISMGIRIIGFICGDLEAVMGAFMENGLADIRFHMPGNYGKQLQHRFRHHRGKDPNGGDQ